MSFGHDTISRTLALLVNPINLTKLKTLKKDICIFDDNFAGVSLDMDERTHLNNPIKLEVSHAI